MKSEDSLPYSQSTYGILAILSEGPKSGYEIKKFLTAPDVFYWRESYGNIYPILKRLHARELVRRIDADVKKKRRIYYEITDKGKEELIRWLRTPPSLSRFRVEVLMKLRFGQMSGIENIMENIEHYRKLNEREISECNDMLGTLRNNGEDSLENEFRVLTMMFILGFKKATEKWCRESLTILNGLSAEGSDGYGESNED